MTTSQAMQQSSSVSPWRHLLGIIDRPVTTFKAVLSERSWTIWAVPLFVLLLAFATVTVVQSPYLLELSRMQAERQLATLPPEQAQAARASMEFTLSLPFMLVTGLGVGGLTLLLGIIIQSAFLYFGTLLMGGDDLTFGQMFTMSVWARLPMAIGFWVQAGFVAVTQKFVQYTGLSLLVSTGDPLKDAQDPLFALLSGVDIFWLWHLLLIILGLPVVARLSRGSAVALTLLYAALALGLTVLPSLLFGSGAFGG